MVAIIITIYSKYTCVCTHSLPKEGRLLGWQGPDSVSYPGLVFRLPQVARQSVQGLEDYFNPSADSQSWSSLL